ncbi:MAG: amidase [Flavobacteriaceae bacterium]
MADRQASGAFMDYPDLPVAHAAEGPLKGLTLAVKDIFDVAGYRTGCGSPTRLQDAEPATRHAEIVATLLDAGAAFAGKTVTDELAFSLHGINAHYGMPVNGAAPQRITGGSSCGSVSAVSNGLADIALGTDTGGSIRCPASYCGLIGLRPTHGRVSLKGCMTLAQSYDTGGWFARNAEIYSRVGGLLLGEDTASLPGSAVLLTDAMALMEDDRHREAFMAALPAVAAHVGGIGEHALTDGLMDHLWTFRASQGAEIWENFRDWITTRKPALGPGVLPRFEWASRLTAEDAARARGERAKFAAKAGELASRHLIVLPTVPAIAPLRTTPMSALENYRDRALSILMISGLSGLPQITLPLARHDGAPLGVSLMGPKGSDRALIDLGARILETAASTP